MQPGLPITSKNDDAFERKDFAAYLAGLLCLPRGAASLVVGIEGAYGSGKTSCLNMVREALQQDRDKPIIIDYAPWMISTLDSVIGGFFVQLASALGMQSKSKSARNAARKVLQFGKMMAPIKLLPGVEPWGTMVEKTLNAVGQGTSAAADLADLSLTRRKQDLQEQLDKVNRPLVVIVDDLDRLPPDEVRTVFQMLKAVFDFDRVSYLLAYDPQPVTQALSFNGEYNGKAYLEKLVQISYPLPRLSYIHRKDYLSAQLAEVTGELDFELNKAEQATLKAILSESDLVRSYVTPRDIVRVCNRLRLSASSTRGEVCFADLLVFETIELKFPELATRIRQEPERFAPSVGLDPELVQHCELAGWILDGVENTEKQDERKPIQKIIDELGYKGMKREYAASFLVTIFPSLARELGITYGVADLPTRIQNRDALLKVLHCGIASFTFSAREAQSFLNDPADRRQIWADHRERGQLAGWVSYLMGFLSKHPLTDSVALCQLMLDEMKGPDPVPRPPPQAIDLTHHLGHFLYSVIKAIPSARERDSVLDHLVKSENSLALSAAVLVCFMQEYGIWNSGTFEPDVPEEKRIPAERQRISYEHLYELGNAWLATVRAVAAGTGILETQRDVLVVLFRWGQFNGNDFGEVQDYIEKHQEDVVWLKKFVACIHEMKLDGAGFGYIRDKRAFAELLRRQLSEDEFALKLAAHLDDIVAKKNGKSGSDTDADNRGSETDE